MNTKIVTRRADLVALTDEWRDLLARASLTEPVLTPTWLLTWWEVFGERRGRALRTVAVRDRNGRLVGLAPLLRRVALQRRTAPALRLELLGTGEDESHEIASNFLGVLAAAGHEGEVAEALAHTLCGNAAVGRWDELLLTELSADDPLVAPLCAALADRGCRVETTQIGASPYIRLPETWEAYLQDIGGTRRYFLRRTMRDLEQWAGEGGYTLHLTKRRHDLATGMDILRLLHGERWAGQRRGGAFGSELFTEFHYRVSQRLLDADDGDVEVLWLEAHGRPVSALYTIVYRGRVYFYQTGRAMWVPHTVRPGIALHILAIQRAIQLGRNTYDLLGNKVFYKSQLGRESRARLQLRAVAPNPRARFLDAASSALEGVARRVGKKR